MCNMLHAYTHLLVKCSTHAYTPRPPPPPRPPLQDLEGALRLCARNDNLKPLDVGLLNGEVGACVLASGVDGARVLTYGGQFAPATTTSSRWTWGCSTARWVHVY